MVGAWPDKGLVLSGRILSVRPYGPRFACEMQPFSHQVERSGGDGHQGGELCLGSGIDPGQVVVNLHVDSPPRVGDLWEVTSLSPPLVSRVSLAGDEEG